MKRINISLPDELVDKVESYNTNHPEQPISYSGSCRSMLEKLLHEDHPTYDEPISNEIETPQPIPQEERIKYLKEAYEHGMKLPPEALKLIGVS